MHPKEAAIVLLLLLVLALCRCGDGAPRRNSSRGKSTNFNSSQTTPIEVLSDDDDDDNSNGIIFRSNDWSSAVTPLTRTLTRVGEYFIEGPSNCNYGLYDPTIPTNNNNNNNNMFSIANYPPTKTQIFSNATPYTKSAGASKPIARVGDRTNNLTSNINISPPNVSPQNANIGTNNAASAFRRINAGSGNSREIQTPRATIGGLSNNSIGLSRFANPNNRLPPNNASQNVNIGRNNAGGAFQRYNATTSTGETNTSAGSTLDRTNTSNLTGNFNRLRSAFHSYKKS